MAKTQVQLKKPIWLKYTEAEVREIILKTHEKNPELTSEKIGIILRDNYGIPKAKIYGINISQVLKEANKYENPDLKNLETKTSNLNKHLLKNKHDQRTARSFIITQAKLKKVKDYLAFNKK